MPLESGGRGWVTAQYIQTEAAAGLPILDEYGTPAAATAAGTSAGPAETPTATVGPAMADGDSQAAPAVRVTFSATAPAGSPTPANCPRRRGMEKIGWNSLLTPAAGKKSFLLFSLICTGNGSLTVELWQAGSSVPSWGSLICGEVGKTVSLAAGRPYRTAPGGRPSGGSCGWWSTP